MNTLWEAAAGTSPRRGTWTGVTVTGWETVSTSSRLGTRTWEVVTTASTWPRLRRVTGTREEATTSLAWPRLETWTGGTAETFSTWPHLGTGTGWEAVSTLSHLGPGTRTGEAAVSTSWGRHEEELRLKPNQLREWGENQRREKTGRRSRDQNDRWQVA